MTTRNEVLETFNRFFQDRDHQVIPGSSLVPPPGDTVLFTTSGMHPLTPFLLGEPHPRGRRLVDVQRCLRTTDLDEVGDPTHLTVFEMLGSWSLGGPEVGGYLGTDSTLWGVELLQQLGIPLDHLYGTVFGGSEDLPPDEHTEQVLQDQGVPVERLGVDDNWWSNGPTGPCGPDSELFAWTGHGLPSGTPSTDERWVEVWNHVSMTHLRLEDGSLMPLSQRNVDTGMGLERILMVLDRVQSVYDTEPLRKVQEVVESLWPVSGEVSRFVTDHLRSSIVMVGDGILSSNTGRGYVLRRLVRRLLTQLWMLDDTLTLQSFPRDSVQEVLTSLDVEGSVDDVVGVLLEEEERFRKLLLRSRPLVRRTLERSGGILTPEIIQDLHSTHGIPPEVTRSLWESVGE